MERLTAEYAATRRGLDALDTRMKRIETQLERLETAVNVMRAPAPPPLDLPGGPSSKEE
jgi:hypothetical protein